MTATGIQVLKNPRINKGTAFSLAERSRLKLNGLLPPYVSTMDQQVERALDNLRRHASDIEKYIYLSSLQHRNERLYFRLLMEYTQELMPIVYTPTVGQACEEFAANFREAAGLYVSIEDKGRIENILGNWSESEVRLIVVTDGERILGLGDLGANGMGIPIGKLALYCACAGINPAHCLPIMLDLGTENEKYLNDPMYLGLRRHRIRGEEYAEFVDEFVRGVMSVYPKALLQFEDFATDNAVQLLSRYRDKLLCFNDDIQGTAAVALAGLIASSAATLKELSDHTFLFLGAGSAATGIGALLVKALQREGLTEQEAQSRLYYVNRGGLVTKEGYDDLGSHLQPFAKDMENMDFIQTLKKVRPSVLIGASGTAGVFSQSVIEYMTEINEAPVIFALSNPTSKAECSAENAYIWSEGKAVFASGSPFGPVHINGGIKVPGQGNNAYIFPGLGLGCLSANIERINDTMLIAAAEALAECVSDKEIKLGCLYPPLHDIREVSISIALEVARAASDLGLTQTVIDKAFESSMRECLYLPHY